MNKSFLGTGWGFPPTFERTARAVEMLSDEANVRISLEIILNTRLGERVLRSDFGCNMEELVFEPITTTFLTYIRERIRVAILYHEPRVELNSIDFSKSNEEEGLVWVKVEYTIRATNTRFNYVFPFYKEEGTNINL
ncbi:GPW/gp25 family protein [Dyadobacter sp. NIV53]|uniref:GPW/gp25 family protein n=1 Tax=Dyadobacter sp. NIV53 TaxID=2861765 RepID=UPI001E616F07|nr:GPW/gp25 family protein [Dyadobacter sp. NIV53]